MKKPKIKELLLTVSAEEYQRVLGGAGAITKRVSRLWEDKLMKKSGDFRKFRQIRVRAHGVGEMVFPRRTICKTSLGEKPNAVPVFAFKVDTQNIHIVK